MKKKIMSMFLVMLFAFSTLPIPVAHADDAPSSERKEEKKSKKGKKSKKEKKEEAPKTEEAPK